MRASLDDVRSAWEAVPGYLNAATLGLPPAAVVAAMEPGRARLGGQGRASAPGYDAAVARCRELYAALVGVPVGWVAVGSQTSAMVGLLARVPCPTAPRSCCRRATSRRWSSRSWSTPTGASRCGRCPLEGLADAVRPATTVVAFSLAQSADGRIVDAGSRSARPQPGTAR